MSAISGKQIAYLTKEVLQKMRSDASFKSFHDAVILKSKNYSSMTRPVLPRRTRAPRRIEIGTGEPAYPATTQDNYRQIYFESIDLMVNAIEQRFDQPSFAAYAKMESLLVKAFNWQHNSRELQFMEISYADDVDVGMLTAQLEILKVLLKEGDFLCFDDIIVKIKQLPKPERKMINKVISACKLLLVNLATSVSGERWFSTAQRLKTWVRSTMTQERFSNLTILNGHKERTERLSFVDIASEFSERNNNRKRKFGIFKESDTQ